jgi:pimeloyl-ACP methyl ester carboxylesterase
MLALAFAAEYPDAAGPLVLIGCGTFDLRARLQLRARVEARMDARTRGRLADLSQEASDPDERLRRFGELMLPVYSYDLACTDMETELVDARAHRETWEDMLLKQEEGVYPAAFRSIRSPVLMLHGTADPHPGRTIRDGLAPVLPQLEYVEWDHCGHYPWLEREAREEFFSVLRGWLQQRL